MKKFLILLIFFIVGSTSFAFDCKSSTECRIIGRTLINQKEYTLAIECFDRALQMDPEEYLSLAYRAKAKFYLKDYDGMIEDTTLSLEIEQNPDAYGLRASAKLAMGDNRGAIDDISNALILNPQYMKCYEVRARAELNMEDYIGALEDSSKAIKFRDDYAPSYDARARAEMGLKDFNAAMIDFQRAADIYKKSDNHKRYKEMLKMIKYCKRCIK